MKTSRSKNERIEQQLSYLSKPSLNNDYRDRRRLEMKRRFVVLQSRRSHLERELEGIKNSLVSLDQQMQSYEAYDQLTLKN